MSHTNTKSSGAKSISDHLMHDEDEEEQPPEWYRKTLPYLFEKELIENSNRHVRLTTTFHATRKVHPLQAKFYARHEQHVPARVEHYKQRHLEARAELDGNLPRLESRVIGWLPPSIGQRHLSELNFICAPKQRCCFTTFGEKLYAERHTQRPPFNGLRFALH